MPIPFIVGGLAVLAGAAGVGGHLNAKETNEKAQKLSDEAQVLYNNAEASLELYKNETESSLLALGYLKKNVLESSVDKFLQSYDRIKHIHLGESIGLDEISKFEIDQQEIIQLREMSDIYLSTFSSGATGAATGAVIALAANGSLSVVTGGLSMAGTAFMAGEIGVATGLAGSALSFGVAMTPLAAIAVPTLLFTGISSSMKADENLEKARTMYSEAEAAAAKMKISETQCRAIKDRANMFNGLLDDLNKMFSECTDLLDGVTRRMVGISNEKTISKDQITKEECDLIATTRSLAGAVKAVIDTPILSKDGTLSTESRNVYNDINGKILDFGTRVKVIQSNDYNVETISMFGFMQSIMKQHTSVFPWTKMFEND